MGSDQDQETDLVKFLEVMAEVGYGKQGMNLVEFKTCWVYPFNPKAVLDHDPCEPKIS